MRLKHFLLVFLLIISCSSIFFACSTKKPMSSSSKTKKVLCTTGLIQDLVKNIAPKTVRVDVLIFGDMDPHSYELVKGDSEKFAESALVFANGLLLEHSASMQYILHEHPNVVFLGNEILQKFPEKILYVDGQLDPHIWMDPKLWQETIPFIRDALMKIFPEEEEEIMQNAEKTWEELELLNRQLEALFRKLPPEKKYLVTTHDAFNYFVRHYFCEDHEKNTWNQRINALQGLAPDDQISPLDIERSIHFIRSYQVKAIFFETNLSPESLMKVVETAKKMGVDVQLSAKSLYGDTLGSPGSCADTYKKMLVYNSTVIFEALGGNEEARDEPTT